MEFIEDTKANVFKFFQLMGVNNDGRLRLQARVKDVRHTKEDNENKMTNLNSKHFQADLNVLSQSGGSPDVRIVSLVPVDAMRG